MRKRAAAISWPVMALVTALWLAAVPKVPAQNTGQNRGGEQGPQQDVIKVDTALIPVPVIVTDANGRFVTGLTRSDFRLREDGVPQEIASFSSTEAPFNVALLIDTSRSTRELLGTIRKAARSFVNQLQPQDRVLIVTFDERVSFLGDFTSDRRQLQRTINAVKSSYLTTVYDAISRTINEKLAPLSGRKAIVIFSDGVDTWSRQATSESTLDLVARSGVLVYAVQYNTGNVGGTATSPYLLPRRYFAAPFVPGQQDRLRAEFERYRIATNFLRSLADQSGARHLQAESIENSERAFALIADELRHQYMLAYYPTNDQHDGSYRAISVSVRRRDFVVRARRGYRVPKVERTGVSEQGQKPAGEGGP
ncbi:MAG TPA: VWA domain-containing protein [Blastocatellia bacterium]|nr:VWA domain-containing protein [Blastocatellia bacterium]